MKNDIETRRANYFKLNTYLTQLDTNQLRQLFVDNKSQNGWGQYHVIRLGGKKVFVKRLLVTDLEYENMYSTKNFYRLPTYYNYGVGSAGLGVFREITALIKTTNAVLAGEAENFPLLYHHRIIPYMGERPKLNMERHKGYVRYWNNNKQVGQYRIDRTQAKYEVMMFFEHVPHDLWRWFRNHSDQVDMVINGMQKAISYLIKNDVIHFDCHWGNIMTDGEQVYLADFGLVLEKRFQLSKREQDFFKGHKYYDAGEFLCGLEGRLNHAYDKLSKKKKAELKAHYGIDEEMHYRKKRNILRQHVEHIHASGLMNLPDIYVDRVLKYKEIIGLMHNFYGDLTQTNRKNTKFPHAKLLRMLKEVAFVA